MSQSFNPSGGVENADNYLDAIALSSHRLSAIWLRRKREGLKHLEAVTSDAIKLCPVVWRIMTDSRNYLPQRPVTKT